MSFLISTVPKGFETYDVGMYIRIYTDAARIRSTYGPWFTTVLARAVFFCPGADCLSVNWAATNLSSLIVYAFSLTFRKSCYDARRLDNGVAEPQSLDPYRKFYKETLEPARAARTKQRRFRLRSGVIPNGSEYRDLQHPAQIRQSMSSHPHSTYVYSFETKT